MPRVIVGCYRKPESDCNSGGVWFRLFKESACRFDVIILACHIQLNEAVLGALDLLLRWVVLRVCEGNTQCLLRILELAGRLLDNLYDQVRRDLPCREACGHFNAVVSFRDVTRIEETWWLHPR